MQRKLNFITKISKYNIRTIHLSICLRHKSNINYIKRMTIQNKCYMRHKPYTKCLYKRWIIRVWLMYDQMQRASIIVSQIQCHWVFIDISDTCSQSICIYTTVVVATFAYVKVWVHQHNSIKLTRFSQLANPFIFTVCLQ
jgi:hypothetical protein